MSEILKPTVKDYFEPLKNLHKKEYPLEPRELKDIVESTIEGLLHTIKRLDKMRKQGNLTEEEQVYADSFLFYCQKLVENKVSPIGIRAVKKNNKKNLFYVSDILIKFNLNNGKTVYRNIIDQDSAYVSHGWLITENNVPKLKLGNFHLHFVRSPYNPPLLNLLKNNYNGEIINIFINQLKNKQLLWGDINYGKKNSLLSYIGLNGKEVVTGKTKYEAWEEFKSENPKLFEKLVEVCNFPLLQGTGKKNIEIYSLLVQAFTLLRIKGFVLYLNLTA